VNFVSKASAFPPTVQPGHPTLDSTPEGWIRAPIGQFLKEKRRPVRLDNNQLFNLVTVKRARGGIVVREKLSGRDISVKSQFRIEADDFLISKRQIVHGACGLVPADLAGSIVSNEYAVLETESNLDRRFLSYLSHTPYFQQTCFHSSIGVHVEKMIFKLDRWFRWKFNFPPLPEQEKIAEILSTWDRAIETAEKLLANAETQKQALMRQLLTGKKRLDGFGARPWEMRRLVDCCEAKGSYGANAAATNYNGVDPRFLRITDILTDGTLAATDMKALPRSQADGYFLTRGDIVFARSGATVGKAYLHRSNEELAYAGYLIKFRPRPDVLLPGFLFHFVRSDEYRKWVEVTLRAGAQPNINAAEYGNLQIPCPSIDEQKFIAAILDNFDRRTAVASRDRGFLENEKRALMRQLLTGKRRVTV